MSAPLTNAALKAFGQAVDRARSVKLAERARRMMEVPIDEVSAEEFLESADYCDLGIGDGQRGLVRAAEGLPVTHLNDLDREYFLGTRGEFLPPQRPEIILVRSGRRSGKSLIAMLLLIKHALTVKLRRKPEPGERAERDGLVGIGQGERVRLAVVAARMTQSLGTFKLALDRVRRSPKLRQYLLGDLSETAKLQRDDGQVIELEVLAAASRGNNLRSGWFIGAVLDEADFVGEKDASVSLNDQIEAVQPALVDGGQIFLCTSPWDDSGQFAKMHTDAFGEPGELVAFHSSTQRLNPLANLKRIEKKRLTDPEFVSREYDAIPMTVSGGQFFPEASILTACVGPTGELGLAAHVIHEPTDAPHWAGSDPGLARDSATLAIARYIGGKSVLTYWEELIPVRKSRSEEDDDAKIGAPPGLKPSVVFESFATTAMRYNCECIEGDQFYSSSAIEHMAKVQNANGNTIYYKTRQDNADSKAALFTKFRELLNEGKVVLPKDPRIVAQLKNTKTKKGQHGKISIVMPRQDGSHADLLKALVMAIVQVPLDSEDEGNDRGRVARSRHGRRW